MMQADLFTLGLASFFYTIGTILYEGLLITRKYNLGKWAAQVMPLGLGIHTLSLVLRWQENGRLPLDTSFDVLSLFGWLLVFSYLILERAWHERFFGAFFTPLVLPIVIGACLISKGSYPLLPGLTSVWLLPLHVIVSFLAYAAFTLSFTTAIVYLWQERALKEHLLSPLHFRLPTLSALERLSATTNSIGFILITLSIISGAVWASNAWGSYWNWNSKEVCAAITWFIYGFYLTARHLRHWNGRRVSWLAIVGFISLLVTFLGVNLLEPGPHHYFNF